MNNYIKLGDAVANRCHIYNLARNYWFELK